MESTSPFAALSMMCKAKPKNCCAPAYSMPAGWRGFCSPENTARLRSSFRARAAKSNLREVQLGMLRGSAMTLERQVLEKFRELPPEKQKEVLDFVDSLQGKDAPKAPRRSLRGLWADLNINITDSAECHSGPAGSDHCRYCFTPRPTARNPRSTPSGRRTSNYWGNPLAIFSRRDTGSR